MYRVGNRRKNDPSGVKGPNSALTQFLKEQGISAENIREKWLESQKKKLEDTRDASDTESDSEAEVNPALRRRKRTGPGAKAQSKRRSSGEGDESEGDSDDEDYGDGDNEDYTPENRLRRLRGTVLQDSDEEEDALPVSERKKGVVSLTDGKKASPEQLKAQHQQRKRRRKKTAGLLDGNVSPIYSLQDICIKFITKSIIEHKAQSDMENIRDALGGISLENLNKLAKALTKNRALDDNTLQLFLNTRSTSLEFHDCSKLSYEGYKRLAIFSPQLESLSLQMCGKLNNEALFYLAEKLPNLKELYLDGPFLINEPTWVKFFELMKGRLMAFHISNTHRFDDSALAALLKNCGSTLCSLGLATLDAVTNYALLPQYLNSSSFHSLIMEEPSRETDINDEVVINLLGSIGSSLKKLSLNRCTGLTDDFILNGILPFVGDSRTSGLEVLELEELDQVTTDGMVLLFSSKSFPRLIKCSLKRCFSLEDAALVELCLAAGASLEEVNLNGLKTLTSNAFSYMVCPNLKFLNLGFIHCVDDDVIELLSKNNPQLEVIEVYGDNRVTSKCSPRKGVSILGRQSDSI